LKKFTQLPILGLTLAIKVLCIYFKKFLGIAPNQEEYGYLTYYNLLLNNGFTHVKEYDRMFKISTANNVNLYLRKYPSSDAQVMRQIWTDEEYAVIVDLIRKHFKPGSLNLIDAGANVGYSSVYLELNLRPDYELKIVPIEPSTENINILKLNFGEHQISTDLIENAGLYNKTCFLEMVKEFRDGKDWSIQVKEVNYETSLRAIQIGDVVDKNQWKVIDFLKIDIEGAERFLFNDSGYENSFLPIVKLISIEIHKEYDISEKIFSSLKDNNFDLFEHGELVIGINRKYIHNYK
jgi:FkbM family methyltransferase